MSIVYDCITAQDGRLILHCPALVNQSDQRMPFDGIRYFCGRFSESGARCLAFRSEWGREFTPQWYKLDALERPLCIGSHHGRSSHGYSPFVYLLADNGAAMAIAVCHSGSWSVEINCEGEVFFCMEHTYFSGALSPGESLPLPKVLTVSGKDGLFSLCAETRQWLEENYLCESRVPQGCFEWNHWWTYEDCLITQELFLQNAEEAAQLGVNLCTLDAGWFGSADNEAHWTQCRGDWDLVNEKRFPLGLRFLADRVHELGMLFGIWIEPEALGALSKLITQHPEWAPQDTSCTEPYLCLGASGVADWLYETLCGLVDSTNCDWIKLDFNVDPQEGCHCADHGHEGGMGLYRHYEALYQVLARLRASHPKLVIENCSSGGLRLDLEIMRYADVAFLSDPDETAHSLQCLWGASLLLSPHRLLHWCRSQTRHYADGTSVFPSFEIISKTPKSQIVAAMRCSMLHQAGMCRELFHLPEQAKEIIKEQIAFYKKEIAPLLFSGTLMPLTPQPMRTLARTDDERDTALAPEAFLPLPYAAFCLSDADKAYVFVFALEEACECAISIPGFQSEVLYDMVCVDNGAVQTQRAKEEKLFLQTVCEKDSSLLYLIKRRN